MTAPKTKPAWGTLVRAPGGGRQTTVSPVLFTFISTCSASANWPAIINRKPCGAHPWIDQATAVAPRSH
jgi:hypothetical protein